MSRRLLLCRYLMMIRTSQHWIPKQTHLWWVSRAAPLSRLTRKQPHPVKNPLNLSVLSCVHSMKFIKKTCRPCFLPKRLQQDHFCSLLTRTSLTNVTQPHSKRWAANQSTIVARETDLSTAALASVDVLFTDDEMARCKTSVTKGFHQLDNGKLGRLCPFFSEQWNHIAARINKKCRAKRRTLIHRLKKTSLFRKHKDGTISLSFPTKDYGLVNWTELFIVQQNRVLSYFKFD